MYPLGANYVLQLKEKLTRNDNGIKFSSQGLRSYSTRHSDTHPTTASLILSPDHERGATEFRVRKPLSQTKAT